MASSQPFAAVDSSALLSLFLNRTEDRERVQAVRGLLEDGEYQIVIPSLVGVEIVSAIPMRRGKQSKPIKNSAIAAARAFLDRPEFMVAELDRRSMVLAGQLGPERMVKPPDAAIVATALSAGCAHVFTYDKDMIKKCDGWQGIHVAEPPASTALPIPFSPEYS